MTAYAPSMRIERNSAAGLELRRIWELACSLAWRDLRVRYKQSVLGIAWAVVQPFSLLLVFTLVLGSTIGRSATGGIPYGLFAFAGLVPWGFFSGTLTQCTSSLVNNRNLITKVYFPREALPVSCVLAGLVDLCIGMSALGALMVFYHAKGTWALVPTPAILFVPLIFLIQSFLTAGLGMLAAMGNLFYRDVRHVLAVVLQMGMFVSAVVVPRPTGSSWFAAIISCNPLAPIIESFRSCLLLGRIPSAADLLYPFLVSTTVFLVGWLAFRKASFRFAECI